MIRRVFAKRQWRALALFLIVLVPVAAIEAGADAYTGTVDSANARYVVATYRQFLDHDPGDVELDAHLDRLAAGGDISREQVARALLFGERGSANEVDRAYQSILGRSAEPSGSRYWTAHLQDHDVLDLRVLLMSSDEYVRRSGGTNRAWITALYRDVLGRKAESAGLSYWTQVADRGVARPIIVAGFYLSRESLGNRTDAYYRIVLDRAPTAAERAAGASTIAAEGERSFYARLWASDEAFEPYFDLGWEASDRGRADL